MEISMLKIVASIGARIAQMRKLLKMSQADLALRMNCTVQTVSNWESDKREPDFSTFGALCEIFRADPKYLLGYETSDTGLEWLAPWEELLDRLDDEGQDAIIAVLRLATRRLSGKNIG